MAEENPNRLQRLPLGLLSMLGIKSTGRNPVLMESDVKAVVDVEKYYLATQTITITTVTTGLSGAPGDSDIATVPGNETWILFGTGINLVGLGAGDTPSFSVFVRTNTAANSLCIGTFTQDTAASAGDRFDRGLMLPQPLVLPAGSTITWLNERAYPGLTSIAARHLIVRL